MKEEKRITFFSVVIPTLGGEELSRTINLLNNGTTIPNEILICIPEGVAERVEELTLIKNVIIIPTKGKGQVRQRCEGFQKAVNEYVIQLDDDIFVDRNCFEKLIEGISKIKGKVAIAPSMVFEPGGQSCYQQVHTDSRSMTFIHGNQWFKPGKLTRSGMNIGLNSLNAIERYNEVEWLPGGCVIHKKENLVLFDYFPFKGKAFYEDVIQSIHLQKKGVKLFIDKEAIVGIDPYETIPYTHWQTLIDFRKYFKYRKHVIELKGGSILYLLLDGLHITLFTTFGVLKQWFNSLNKR